MLCIGCRCSVLHFYCRLFRLANRIFRVIRQKIAFKLCGRENSCVTFTVSRRARTKTEEDLPAYMQIETDVVADCSEMEII